MKRSRHGRKKPVSRYLSISAINEEWGITGNHAERRNKSKERYLVDLALDAGEQRKMQVGLRSVRRLMAQDDNGRPLIADMQTRVAVEHGGQGSAGRSEKARLSERQR